MQPDKSIRKVMIFGAGKVGTSIARAALAAGIDVHIASSGEAEATQLMVDFVAPGAKSFSANAAELDADLVILAVPLPKYKSIKPDPLAGKIVIDAMNYWPATDGAITEFSDPSVSSSEVVQAFFAKSEIVKTLNHISYHDIDEHPLPRSDPKRRALGLASDYPDAAHVVAGFLDQIGYDPVNIGALKNGRLLQPGTRVFNTYLNAKELKGEVDEELGSTE